MLARSIKDFEEDVRKLQSIYKKEEAAGVEFHIKKRLISKLEEAIGKEGHHWFFDQIEEFEEEAGLFAKPKTDDRKLVDSQRRVIPGGLPEIDDDRIVTAKGNHITNIFKNTRRGAEQKYVLWLLIGLGRKYPKKAKEFYQAEWPDEEFFFKLENQQRFRTDESSLFSPRNHKAIPLIGREEEIAQLDEFINDDASFKLWAIVGPSGSGKTRLTFEWGNREELNGWDAKLLHIGDDTDWSTWEPQKRTLIVIDYIYGFDKIIKVILDRFAFSEQSNEPRENVRLLILDHATTTTMAELIRNPRWSDLRRMEGSRFGLLESAFFAQSPLNLTATDKQDGIIEGIICEMANLDKGTEAVKDAVAYLKNMRGGWHPLFAALVGEAMGANWKTGYMNLNRRQLIKNYLTGDNRRTWDMETAVGRWAGCFIAAATATGGANFNAFRNRIPENDKKEIQTDWKRFVSLCHGVSISSDEQTEHDENIDLKPFGPDILGETHFLLFLEETQSPGNDFAQHLPMLIAIGDEDTLGEKAVKFAAFIARLARNLLKEDQDDEETKMYWRLLLNFLSVNDFEKSRNLRWAVSASLFEISKSTPYRDIEQAFLAKATHIDAYHPPKKFLDYKYVVTALRAFDSEPFSTREIPEELIKLLAHFDKLEDERGTSVMLASYVGCADVLARLIANGADYHAQRIDGSNALMFASQMNRYDCVLMLIDADVDLDLATIHKTTALMLACKRGQKDVARLLVKSGADTSLADIGGKTTLMYAAQNSSILSLDKDEQIEWVNKVTTKLNEVERPHHIPDKSWRNLEFACYLGDEDRIDFLFNRVPKKK